MDILNCEYEDAKIVMVNHLKNLVDIVQENKEKFWEFEENSDKIYDLENMKLYEEILVDRPKNTLKNNNPSIERAELIKIIYNQIGSEKPANNLYFKKNNKKLILNYYCLASVVTVIQRILKNIIVQSNFNVLLDEVLSNNFCHVFDSEIWGMSLMKLKDQFNQVEHITFGISGYYDEEFDINYIVLFYYFYKLLFPKVNSITLKSDFVQAYKKYIDIKNPYDFLKTNMKDISKKYENLYFANFLLLCIISSNTDNLINLKIKATESYVSEINYILCKQFKKSGNEAFLLKDKSLILFKKLMKIKSISNISLSINCLDRFLFKDSVNFISFYQNLERLELNLFFNPRYYNPKKIYLNYLKGEDFCDTNPNQMDKYGVIYYPYINKLSDDILSIIEEDKLPDLMFREFKRSLTNLKIILNQFITRFLEFSLDITPYEELTKFQNYNVQIILFIMSVLASLENSDQIENFKLKCSNIDYSIVSQIVKNVNKLITPKLIDLSKCEKLKKLELDVQGISLFIDFDKLPFNSLQKLDISISNLKDMEKVSAFLKNNKNNLLQLTQLNISLLFVYDTNFIMKEFIKIFENIPPCIKELIINNENLMRKEEILEILKKIRNNKISFICKLECVCPEIEKFASDKKLNDFQTFLNTKGNIKADNLKLILESKKCINLDFILFPDIDKINSIIFCLNKMIKDSGDKKEDQYKKMYSNIIKFMAKRQNISILLN